jgi:four helix bundle protein
MEEFLNKDCKYDLEDRTLRFSENLIDLVKKCPKDIVTIPIINQLIRSGTSIGANYCEANGASSKKDFLNKIFICKKEAKETMYWLHLLARALFDDKCKETCRILWKETQELTFIFSKIASNVKS